MRRDRTQTTRAQRADWEIYHLQEDMSSNREEQKQDALLGAWEDIYARKGRGENVSEMELARRISAVSEGDTREGRVNEARRNFEITEKVEQKLREQIAGGQSEIEFYKELDNFGANYRKALNQAVREVKI